LRAVTTPRSWTALLATCLLASGCATTAVEPVAGVLEPDPDVLTQWTAKGRIALVAQGEGGSGSFVWQQRSERTELIVRGPLGAGGLEVITDGETLELANGAGQPLDGDAARAALEQRLGVALPLAQLRYWMLGIPAPDEPSGPAKESGDSAVVAGFVQAGWTVSFDALGAQAGWRLPTRMSATTGSTRVRIVIDDWQLPTP
jgi:outer membrane lipoprotein LolB